MHPLLNALGFRRRDAQGSSHRKRLTGVERDRDAAPATGRREHSGIDDNSTGDDDIPNRSRHLAGGSEVTHRNAGPPSNSRSKCKMRKPTTTTKNSVTQIQVLSSWTARDLWLFATKWEFMSSMARIKIWPGCSHTGQISYSSDGSLTRRQRPKDQIPCS